MPSILFVCLGNICRSPAAEGVLRHLAPEFPDVEEVWVESCGIGGWHVGQLPDSRMQQSALARGIRLTSRAQQFHFDFFQKFDYILAADREVLHDLYRLARTPEHKAKTRLITEFSSCYREEDIPDPYHRGNAAFELVLDMLEDSCKGLLEHLSKLNTKNKELKTKK